MHALDIFLAETKYLREIPTPLGDENTSYSDTFPQKYRHATRRDIDYRPQKTAMVKLSF